MPKKAHHAQTPQPSGPRPPTGPWDARVQFRADDERGVFSYRPNQLITVRGALRLIDDRIGRDREGHRLVRTIGPQRERDDDAACPRSQPPLPPRLAPAEDEQ